jgi:hypothetical protein
MNNALALVAAFCVSTTVMGDNRASAARSWVPEVVPAREIGRIEADSPNGVARIVWVIQTCPQDAKAVIDRAETSFDRLTLLDENGDITFGGSEQVRGALLEMQPWMQVLIEAAEAPAFHEHRPPHPLIARPAAPQAWEGPGTGVSRLAAVRLLEADAHRAWFDGDRSGAIRRIRAIVEMARRATEDPTASVLSHIASASDFARAARLAADASGRPISLEDHAALREVLAAIPNDCRERAWRTAIQEASALRTWADVGVVHGDFTPLRLAAYSQRRAESFADFVATRLFSGVVRSAQTSPDARIGSANILQWFLDDPSDLQAALDPLKEVVRLSDEDLWHAYQQTTTWLDRCAEDPENETARAKAGAFAEIDSTGIANAFYLGTPRIMERQFERMDAEVAAARAMLPPR